MSDPRWSVIIPAFNEAHRLPPYLAAVVAYLDRRGEPFEVIVVDDGSTDSTSAVAAGVLATNGAVRLLRTERNEGKGASVRRGMLAARGRFRLFADADGATPIAELERFEPALAAGADIVIGSRRKADPGVSVVSGRDRVAARRLFNVIVRSLGLRGITDSQCGFKAFTARAAEDLFSRLSTRGFGFDVELLLLAQRVGYRVVEVAVNWSHQAGGKVGVLRTGPGVVADILVARIRLAVAADQIRRPALLRSRRAEWAALAAAFGALAAVAAVWLTVDSRPPVWDYANHLERAVRCAADLTTGNLDGILARSSFYPPLVPCTAALAYLAVPSDAGVAQAVIVAFLGLGMAATYWLGRHFVGGPAGIVAALVFGSAPFVVHLSVRFQLDLPLAAMVAATLVLLVKTEGFARPGWSVAVGLLLGLGMLTKPTFLIYVLPALAVVAAGARTRLARGNVALAGALAVVLSLPWYGRRMFGLVHQITSRAGPHGVQEGDPDPFTLAGLAWYPQQLPMQFGWLAAALFCVGLVVALRRRQWLLVASVFGPFTVFLLIQNKDPRYTLPLLPVAAVLASASFATLPPRARGLAVATLVTVSALQVSASAFGMPAGWRLPLLGAPFGIASPPAAEEWRQREILAFIDRDAAGAPATVSIVPNHHFFALSNFRYYLLREGLPMRVVRAWQNEPLGVDYMVLKTGAIGPDWTVARAQRVEERLARDPHLARVFPVLAELPLPDGSTATLRGRRISSGLDVPVGRLAEAIEEAFRRRLGEFAQDIDGLEVRLTYDQEIRRGRVSRIVVSAATATVGELERRGSAVLRLHDVRVTFDDVLVNPYSAWLGGRFAPLDLGRLVVEGATVTADDLRALLARLRGLDGVSARLEEGAIAISFALPGFDVAARVRLLAGAEGPFTLVAEDVRLAGLPVPEFVSAWVARQLDPGPRLRALLPLEATIAPVTITPQALRIGP